MSRESIRVYCSCCGKQVIRDNPPPHDKHCTTRVGAIADFGNKVICGYCAKDLDDNGMFPGEE